MADASDADQNAPANKQEKEPSTWILSKNVGSNT